MMNFKVSAFLQLLAMRLTEFPCPNRYDLEENRREEFLRHLHKKGENPKSHPILPGLQVNIECFQHLFNMRMHQHTSKSKMSPCGTWFLTAQKTKNMRERFLELYSSEQEFVMCMSCTGGIFIKMDFTPNMSGEGYQLAFQVFGGTRSLFQTKVDVTLEKGTSKFQIALKIHEHDKRVSFFYDRKIFFPILFSVDRYSEETEEAQIVSFRRASNGYKPGLAKQESLKRVKM
jgi:hypothetical protein